MLISACAGCGESTGNSAPASAPPIRLATPPGGKIDPEPYRAQIEALEENLYVSRPGDAEDFRRIGLAVLGLVNQIGALDGSPPARSAGGKLLFFSARAENGNRGARPPGMNGVRKDWEKLRAQLFKDASWYRRITPGLALRSRAPSTANPRDLAAVGGVIGKLQRLMERGSLEVIGLGEPRYQPDAIDESARSQIESWRDWGHSWNERVRDALKSLPDHPGPMGPKDLIAALERVDLAVLQLERIDRGDGEFATPFQKEWKARFERAALALAEARSYLPPGS